MKRPFVNVAVLTTVAGSLFACASADDDNSVASSSTDVEYEVLTMVLEDESHGPMLCLGGVLTSMPPQCGEIPILNWDWSDAPDVRSESGAQWSENVVVTGTFDGETMTATGSPRAPTDADRERLGRASLTTDFSVPCSPPDGGWESETSKVPDGTDFNALMQTFGAYVTSQPDFASWWHDQSINPNYSTAPMNESQAGRMNDPQHLIMVAAFTGDLDRHQTELREIWPGALCLTTAPRSNADRDAIDRSVQQLFEAGELGPTSLLGTRASLLGDVVLAEVTVVTPELRSALDQRFGVGAVELTEVFHAVGN